MDGNPNSPRNAQSAVLVARLMILGGATVLFAAAWSSDRPRHWPDSHATETVNGGAQIQWPLRDADGASPEAIDWSKELRWVRLGLGRLAARLTQAHLSLVGGHGRQKGMVASEATASPRPTTVSAFHPAGMRRRVGTSGPATASTLVTYAPSARPEQRNSTVEQTLDLAALEMLGVPIPLEIAEGRYRVVGSDGRVLAVDVSEDDLLCYGYEMVAAPRDVYQLNDGRQRWYFVRLDDRPAPVERFVERDASATPHSAQATFDADRAWSAAVDALRAIRRQQTELAEAASLRWRAIWQGASRSTRRVVQIVASHFRSRWDAARSAEKPASSSQRK